MLNRIALFVSLVILSLFFYYIYSLNDSYQEKNNLKSLDNGLLLAKNLLEEEQRYALTISALICKDAEFLKAYNANDRKLTFDVINKKIDTLNSLEQEQLDVQVHDKNSNTYLRSWDYNITNVPLGGFREGVVWVKEKQQAIASVEVGKRLNIKAISPIIENGKFKGSIEVIIGFKHLQEKLLEQGYSLFILLDKKYLNIATSLQGHPFVKDKYVLVNKNYNENIFEMLKRSDLNHLGSYGYFTKNNISFGYFELNNLHNEQIGYCILALQIKGKGNSSKHYAQPFSKENQNGVIIR
jgi:hypothetical protein